MEAKLVVAGIDVHKSMLAVVVVDDDNPQQALDQWGWNRRPNTGDRYGWLWSKTLSCIWRRPSPTRHRTDGSRISWMRCGWRGGSWPPIKTELCAGCRATKLACLVSQQASEKAAPGTGAESDGGLTGREPDEAVECGDRSCWGYRARILKALARGESNPEKLVELAANNLKASPEQLADALSGS